MNLTHKHHGYYYFAELLVLLCGFFSVYMLRSNFKLQELTMVVVLVLYTILGILHHTLHHDLRLKIVIEYTLVSILIFACFLLLKL